MGERVLQPTTMPPVYQELIDFFAAGTTPDRIIAFQASDKTKAQVADLIRKEKTTGLSSEETADLNRYLEYEHFMRLAKAQARKQLLTN